jgi:hypothetical protein
MTMTDETEKGEAMKAEEAPAKSGEQVAESSTPRWVAVAGVVSLLGALLIYVLRLDHIVGLFIDDGWYVLLANSLATGQGYSLINSPSPGVLPLYPPAFPFLLSIVYRISPDFPENLWLLKSVSVAAMMGAGVVAYRYFTGRKLSAPLALAISVASALSPPLVFLATSTVMSECVFTFIAFLTIAAMERVVRAGQSARGLRLAVVCAALASAAFLTRSMAVGLIAAGVLYLVKERLIKSAVVFAAAASLFAGPWVIYARMHTPTLEQQREIGGHIVQPYTTQFWQRYAGDMQSGTITIKELPARVWDNLKQIAGFDVARVVATPIIETLLDPAEAARRPEIQEKGDWNSWVFAILLSLLIVAGFVATVRERVTFAEIAIPLSLLIVALWPWQPFRLIMPFVPFFIFYALMGLRAILRAYPAPQGKSPLRARQAVLGVAAAIFVIVNLYGNVNYLLKKFDTSSVSSVGWIQIFDEMEEMFNRADRELPKDAVIASSNPPLTHLYLNRKTISTNDPVGNFDTWKRLGVRYMMSAAVLEDKARPQESGYKIVYQSRVHPQFWIVDLGDPATRER